MKINNDNIIPPRLRVVMFNHTKRSLLLEIRKDGRIFNPKFVIDIAMDAEKIKQSTGLAKDNLTISQALFLLLTEEGYIKSKIINNEILNKLTPKAYWYLITHSPTLNFWGVVIATTLSIIANNPNASKILTSATKEVSQQPKEKHIDTVYVFEKGLPLNKDSKSKSVKK